MTDQELVNQAYEAKDNLSNALRLCYNAGLDIKLEAAYIDNPSAPDGRSVFWEVSLHVSRPIEPNSKP